MGKHKRALPYDPFAPDGDEDKPVTRHSTPTPPKNMDVYDYTNEHIPLEGMGLVGDDWYYSARGQREFIGVLKVSYRPPVEEKVDDTPVGREPWIIPCGNPECRKPVLITREHGAGPLLDFKGKSLAWLKCNECLGETAEWGEVSRSEQLNEAIRIAVNAGYGWEYTQELVLAAVPSLTKAELKAVKKQWAAGRGLAWQGGRVVQSNSSALSSTAAGAGKARTVHGGAMNNGKRLGGGMSFKEAALQLEQADKTNVAMNFFTLKKKGGTEWNRSDTRTYEDQPGMTAAEVRAETLKWEALQQYTDAEAETAAAFFASEEGKGVVTDEMVAVLTPDRAASMGLPWLNVYTLLIDLRADEKLDPDRAWKWEEFAAFHTDKNKEEYYVMCRKLGIAEHLPRLAKPDAVVSKRTLQRRAKEKREAMKAGVG